MIRAADIRALRTTAPDYPEAERLKDALRRLRSVRTPLFLVASELDPIFRWKLRGQYGRVERLLARNTDDVYKAVTRATFSVRSNDRDYDVELRLGLLTALSGVGVPVASAVLALAEPDYYCVIDFRGWRAVFNEDRRSFDIPSYKRYLAAVRKLAAKIGWPVQDVDLAIWQYDRLSTKQRRLTGT